MIVDLVGGNWLTVACAVTLIGCGFAAPDNGGDGDDPDPVDGNTGIGGQVCGGPIEAADLISQWQFSRASRELDDRGIAAAEVTGQVNTISGPTRCGDAVSFGDSQQSYLLINDRMEWDSIGSLDFFARYPASLTVAGILSRDSNNSNNGNVGIYLGRDTGDTTSLIVMRVQRQGATDVVRCAPAPAPETWFHVGVNFGGDDGGDDVELWIDGLEGVATFEVNAFADAITCGSGNDRLTIDGSPDQWFLGIGAHNSDPNSTNNLELPFSLGSVDNLRFANQRRDFSAN